MYVILSDTAAIARYCNGRTPRDCVHVYTLIASRDTVCLFGEAERICRDHANIRAIVVTAELAELDCRQMRCRPSVHVLLR